MKLKDLFNFNLSAFSEAFKGDKTDEDLNVELSTDTLEDGTVLAFEAIENDKQVFVVLKDEKPKLLSDGEYKLSTEQTINIIDGKITEVKEKEVVVELSDDQKKAIAIALALDVATLESLVDLSVDGYHSIDFNVSDGKVQWADMYSNTWKALLASDENPLKVKLSDEVAKTAKLEAEKVTLNAQIALLQEQNVQENPLKTKKSVKLEDEKPLTRAEIIKENIQNIKSI